MVLLIALLAAVSPVDRSGPQETLEVSGACVAPDFRDVRDSVGLDDIHAFLDRAQPVDREVWHYCSLVTECSFSGVVQRDGQWVGYTIYPTGYAVRTKDTGATSWLVCDNCGELGGADIAVCRSELN